MVINIRVERELVVYCNHKFWYLQFWSCKSAVVKTEMSRLFTQLGAVYL